MKKEVIITSIPFSLWSFDGMTIKEAIEEFKNIENRLVELGAETCKIDISIFGDYDNDSEFRALREETVKEFRDRKREEKMKKDLQESKEKELYLQLKEKYNN